MPHEIPEKYRNYGGYRLNCFHCGRKGVPAPDGFLLVAHRKPESDALCPFGNKKRQPPRRWETAKSRPEVGRAYRARHAAKNRQKEQSVTAKKLEWDYAPPADEPEPDLARRPCPKCGAVVTWTDGSMWPHGECR